MQTLAKSLKELKELLELLPHLEKQLDAAADLIAACLLNGSKLLVCGNGGSAADAAHFATEFTVRFQQDRRPYPAMALTVDGAMMTAVGNDYEFRDVFARQVDAFGQAGDVLVALTTSGKSRNVLEAIEMARRRGLKVVLFAGKGGGFCKNAADVEILIPESTVTARIQEAQKFLLHVLCEEMESRLPRE